MTVTTPPFAYYGGKARLASRIVELVPDHRIYIEPYAGSLAVLLAKPPCTHEVVNDLDGDLVNFWRVLRDHTGDLEYALAYTPYARAEYAAAQAADGGEDLTDLERARRWWVRISQSHGRTNTTAGWSTGFMRRGARAHETLRAAGRVGEVAERLRLVTIENRDALDCIAAYDAPDAVIYVDPPYPAQARNSVGYQHEMRDDASHRALAEVLDACSGTVLLSGYPCPLYDDLYGTWQRHEWTGHFRSNGGHRGGKQFATEVVWSNRSLVAQQQLWVVS